MDVREIMEGDVRLGFPFSDDVEEKAEVER